MPLRSEAAECTPPSSLQVLQSSEGKEALCPRCSSVISAGVLSRLPRHIKLCTLVKLLTHFKTDPMCLEVSHHRDSLVQHDGGHPVYSGSPSAPPPMTFDRLGVLVDACVFCGNSAGAGCGRCGSRCCTNSCSTQLHPARYCSAWCMDHPELI